MKLTRSRVGDIALAIALAVVGGTAAAHVAAPVDGWAFAMVVLTALVLVVRRRWPLVTLAAATVLTSAYLILGYPYGPILFSFLVAVYTVACHLPLSRSAPASLAALAILLTHLLTNRTALPGFLGLVPASAWVAVPFAIGVTVRLNRQSVARARAEVGRGERRAGKPARHRAHGHPHAWHRRPGSYPTRHRRPRAREHQDHRAHHVRARRVCLRRAPLRGEWIPAQGHQARRTAAGDPPGR
jgi:hypothetical protein